MFYIKQHRKQLGGVIKLKRKNTEPLCPNEEKDDKQSLDGLFGLDPETSLQSARFATTDNLYINGDNEDNIDEQ